MANPKIFYPTFYGDLESVAALLDSDPQAVLARDGQSQTPLHVAAGRGHRDMALLLLDRGANVQGPALDCRWTPLALAAYRGHLGVVQLLVERGADLSEAGGNPLHFAGQRGHKAICTYLVEQGAVDGLIDPPVAEVLELFRAAYSFDAARVRQLLNVHPELVNRRDRNGRTPLHEAATFGDRATVKVLLESGADPAARDERGQTPLDRARMHRKRLVAELLETSSQKIETGSFEPGLGL